MIKRILLVFFIIFLCIPIGATSGFTDDTSNKLADYVIGFYIKSYVEKKLGHTWGKNALKEDWELLESNSYNDPISQLELESIIEKLPKDKMKDSNGQLINEVIYEKTLIFYNSIKFKRNCNRTIVVDELIKLPSLYFEEWISSKTGKPIFQTEYNLLKNELENIQNRNENPNENFKEKSEEKVIDLSSTKKNDENVKFPWVWLIVLSLSIFIYLKRFWIKKNIHSIATLKVRPSQSKTILKEKPIEKKKIIIDENLCFTVFKWILSNTQNFKIFSEYIVKNEQLLSYWVKSCLKYPEIKVFIEKEFLLSENITTQSKKSNNTTLDHIFISHRNVENLENLENKHKNILYADAIIDGFFNKVKEIPNEDTIFELHLKNNDSATFTIFSGANQLITKRPEFLEGCDKQVLRNSANVKIIKKGETQKQSNGKWKIINKLNLIID
jgi:hypothetical protein